MATGRIRSTRKLKPWLVQQVESGKFPGLVWDDDNKTSFRIPWKHAGKQDFRHDEDAAIFKAWAVYKNKFHNGDKVDAASWKTRLRCALNKSPEFEELPDRSHLDISEPYKVYRIVPVGEQETSGSGKTGKKRKSAVESKDSSSDEGDGEAQNQKRPTLNLDLSSVDYVVVTSPVSPEDSGIGSDSSSTETNSTLQHRHEPLTVSPVLSTQMTNTDMEVTIWYSGIEISRRLVQSGECKISAGAPTMHSCGNMEHIHLPPPDMLPEVDLQSKTKDLLSFLQSGVMVASNSQGIFAQRQRSCQGRIFWSGPCAKQLGEINKLDRHALVKLFDTQDFLRDLELYRTGRESIPSYNVTLCFGEEISNGDIVSEKLITAELKQIMACELVCEASGPHHNVPDQLLQGPPAPYQNPLLPLETHFL
ncbi:interferon regulatory factor 9 [Bombina bombina]|uniref:interferon regulatory factor 9 n=1 Tax=Bombina bombina TaxID=8345 RepID=UPI00235A5A92|nr:interferon regulatory factor 9 [Bombina bombina]